MRRPFRLGDADTGMPAAARIVSRPDAWTPMRPLHPGRQVKVVGNFCSVAMGRALPWEATAERDLFVTCEADARIIAFRAQPHRLEMEVGETRPLTYFPDLERTWADGCREVVEAKRNNEKLDDAYLEKIDLAKQAYARAGIKFLLLRESEIWREPRWSNSRAVVTDKATTVPPGLAVAILRRVGASPCGYGEAISFLGGGTLGRPRLHALVVRRRLTLDLDAPLTDGSAVTLAPGRSR